MLNNILHSISESDRPHLENQVIEHTFVNQVCNRACRILNKLFSIDNAAVILLSKGSALQLSTYPIASSESLKKSLLSSWQHASEDLMSEANFKLRSINLKDKGYHIQWIKILSVDNDTSVFLLIPIKKDNLSDIDEESVYFIAESLSGKLWSTNHTDCNVNGFLLQSLILDNSQDLIFIKDSDFRITYANRSFLNVYPQEKRDKVIGYTTFEEYEPSDVELFLKQDKIAFNEGISKVEETIMMPSGEKKILLTTKQRFVDLDGREYILGIARDITKYRNTITALEKLNAELDEFASIVSHDLRAPLNAIEKLIKWIELDCQAALTEDALENMASIHQRINRMKRLLKDLLKYARVGRENEEVQKLDLKLVVNELLDLSFPDQALDLTVDEASITAPPTMFKTVLTNLLSNAIKHNDKERCKLTIKSEQSPHYFKISISDNGPGIEPQYQERIFKLFHTLKPRDRVEASGIGLSVVKKIVEQVKGRISVESDGQEGTTFIISWPKRIEKGG